MEGSSNTVEKAPLTSSVRREWDYPNPSDLQHHPGGLPNFSPTHALDIQQLIVAPASNDYVI